MGPKLAYTQIPPKKEANNRAIQVQGQGTQYCPLQSISSPLSLLLASPILLWPPPGPFPVHPRC